MAASLDGFIARRDGRVDWLETLDRFDGGEVMAPEAVAKFLRTIDCYVMGSRTYETALNFEAKGFGWSYGDKATFVLTSRALQRTRDTVEFFAGDLARLVEDRLKPQFRNILVRRWGRSRGRVSAPRSRGRAPVFRSPGSDRRWCELLRSTRSRRSAASARVESVQKRDARAALRGETRSLAERNLTH